MRFVDSHCHLYFESYKADLPEVIKRALDAGVEKIIVPGLNLDTSRQAVELANHYDPVYAAVGCHPSEVDLFSDEQLKVFADLLIGRKVIAIGEVGLDGYHRQDNLIRQHFVLGQFLSLARDHHLPVILHGRETLDDLMSSIAAFDDGSPDQKTIGILHAFEGNLAQAEQYAARGFLIGAGGPVAYKSSRIKHELFSKIDLSKVVLETDGPFLSPPQHRGERNEPSFIPLIAQRVAELQQYDITVIAQKTTDAVNKLFNWID